MSKKHGLQEYSVQEAQNIQLGQAGYESLKTTTATPSTSSSGHFIAVTSLSNDTHMYATSAGWAHDPDDVDDEYHLKQIPIGTTIYGSWKKVSVYRSTGTAEAVAYRG